MCSVVGCESERRDAQRFKLPEDPERRLEWVQFLFEVNGQRLKESSWTDITICIEHFTGDCFVNLTPGTGTAQLKSTAAPTLCVKSEPDELELELEPDETTDIASQCDQVKTCYSPSSYSEESAAQESPVPSDASYDSMSDVDDYGQMLQKVVNIDMIREKAALLQMKKQYVVNEKRLLQLFSSECPSCGSKVKTEKVTNGVLIILNQQCLQCEYTNQWKSQVNASVPAAEDQLLTEVVEVTPQTQQRVSTVDNRRTITGMSEMVATIDEESDLMDETEESGNEDDMGSDEDWDPGEELDFSNELYGVSEDNTEEDDEPPLAPEHSRLCTDCGMFYNKRKPHTCEHKTKPYSCNICGKRFGSEIALNSHSRIHNENYEHQCKYCHLTFKTKVDKVTHEQIHRTEGKPYKCSDCSETFATYKERKIHLEDHRGPRQLKCHICGIEFTQANYLRRHLAVHTGVKPFKCSVCQRGFNQPSHLKSHMRLHTGERPYKCQHCDKRFNHNVSLKSHVERYHTPSSGHQKTVINTDTDAQENGNERGTVSGRDDVREQPDKEEEVQKLGKHMTKHKKKRTGRPIGRPKRNAEDNLVLAGEMQGQRSNNKIAKVKVRKLKRKRCSDEESEDEPAESDMSFDSTEEDEENYEKVTLSTRRSGGRAKKSDSDSEERKKKRYSSKSSGKRRGRPRGTQEVEDTED